MEDLPNTRKMLSTRFLPNDFEPSHIQLTRRTKSFKYYWKILLIIAIFYGTPAICFPYFL